MLSIRCSRIGRRAFTFSNLAAGLFASLMYRQRELHDSWASAVAVVLKSLSEQCSAIARLHEKTAPRWKALPVSVVCCFKSASGTGFCAAFSLAVGTCAGKALSGGFRILSYAATFVLLRLMLFCSLVVDCLNFEYGNEDEFGRDKLGHRTGAAMSCL